MSHLKYETDMVRICMQSMSKDIIDAVFCHFITPLQYHFTYAIATLNNCNKVKSANKSRKS